MIDGFYFWELPDCECDGEPCRYKPAILVNFFGTFIITGDLLIDYSECTKGFIDSEEWRFAGSCDILGSGVVPLLGFYY